MFRRSDLEPEAAGIFTWGGRSYHCLADLAAVAALSRVREFASTWVGQPLEEAQRMRLDALLAELATGLGSA